MTPERWQQIEELFHAAADRPLGERAAFLDQACAGDQELRREVESLLTQANRQGTSIGVIISDLFESLDEDHREGMIGQEIGPYRVTGFIGEGGMGSVYRAARNDDQYQKEVAIKLVKRGMDTDFALRRFRHERQILAGLEHANIARLLEGGTTVDGLPYFVMEHIEGRPITRFCKENDLPMMERLKLFQSVCEAVSYAHRNLVIHRDLKPSNILVTQDGSPKLLDFGIAKLLAPELSPEMTAQTLTAVRLMTPDYASPEQVKGEAVTTATDIYSLGVILYEILTERKPYKFKNYSADEIERAICHTEPEKPSAVLGKENSAKLRKQLSGDLDNIVMMALRKEPERRYQSVEQFSEDIRRYLEGQPVMASKDTLGYRVGKFVRRHKLSVAATILVILSLVSGIVATSYQARRAERRFEQVRKLANTFLFDFHEKIQNLPGSTEAQEMVVKTALEYLDSLAQEAEGDSALERELAIAYQKVGNVQGDPYAASLGQTEAAIKSYRKSLALAEKLAAGDAENIEVRRTFAEICFRLGVLTAETYDEVGGQAIMLKGLGVAESLAEQTGERRDIILVKNYYDRIGDTQLDTGDAVGALKNYRYSQELSERLFAADPNNKNQVAVAISHSHIGEALAATGDLAGAIEEYKKSLDSFEALSKKEPDNLAHARGMVIPYFWLGRLSGNPGFVNMGDKATALEYYRKAMAIAERLAATDAKNAFYRLDRIGSYINVADMILEDDPAQAAELYSRTMTFINITLEAEPNESRYLTRRARCLKGQAAIMERAGDRRGAQQNLSQALEILRKLAEANPANVGLHTDLYAVWNALGDLALRAGDTNIAQENYREALALAEKALASTPSHLYSKWRLADSCSRMGRLHVTIASARNRSASERTANWREARDWYKKTVDVWDQWSREAVSSVFNTTRRNQVARALDECEAALIALENSPNSSRSNRRLP